MRKSKSEFQEEIAPITTDVAWGTVYHTLIYSVFQKPREEEQSGMVVALTSANPNEGVTYITRTLSHELAKCEINSVARTHIEYYGSTASQDHFQGKRKPAPKPEVQTGTQF